ncbi:c-type cytochrome biogenesis protein CcmI [Seongchinamella sediminis]|uniref:C-type cytochrome biogenesis protein CcmI n=1 Tax=Seongchinamella sediminis TaxID=2283635 RepID=A0A3L7E3N1_9GAMM|nr:c-type cytochrome biogenesis protein CcmI [Seongchinamella sediminis]RLQ23011.1 c-type cytochrome biogenesis protein CcmI [Seongchinamella sediminis]
MTLLIIACAALLLFSALFYIRPLSRHDGVSEQDLAEANLQWYRQRQQELDNEGDEALAEDARLRLLEDEEGVVPPAHTPGASRSGFPAWILVPLISLFAIVLYYRLGAAPDVLIARQLQSLDDSSTPQEMDALMLAIEERAGQRPDNLHYVAMLGRYYMGLQDYARAAEAYDELISAAPEDAAALAYAAQARYLAAGRQLNDSARMRAEQALAIDPHQRTALGLLGMASFEQGQYRAAVEYWQRLVAMEPPGSETRQMISGIIATALERLGEAPAMAAGDSEPAAGPAADEAGAGVTVSVALPEGGQVAPGDTVFVLARNAASDSRMPIAVQRLRGADLPATLRLDDSKSMAGQKLSETASVMVVVQVSPGGQPGEANSSWLGQAGPLAPGDSVEPVQIVLSPTAGS